MLAPAPSRSRSRGIFLVLGALLLPAATPSQDLAALARKERDRRAKVAQPAKVLTEDDGKEASAKGAGSITSLGAPPDSSAPSSALSTTDLAPQRGAWKTRMDGALKAVAAAEAMLAQMEKDLAAFRSDMSPVSAADAMDSMRLQKREALIFKLNKEIEAQRTAVAEAKKAVAAVEDEARRSGVPAGWLR